MEIELADHYDRMNKVVSELLKGNSPTQIAGLTGFKRAEVIEYIEEWKGIIKNDNTARDRAKEAVSGADHHYAMLIKEAWRTIEQADMQDALNVKSQTLKLIADIESKRIDMLNKAGVLESNDIGDQIIETERKQEILVEILREVTSDCEKCKWEVAKRLSEVTGKVESVKVD